MDSAEVEIVAKKYLDSVYRVATLNKCGLDECKKKVRNAGHLLCYN